MEVHLGWMLGIHNDYSNCRNSRRAPKRCLSKLYSTFRLMSNIHVLHHTSFKSLTPSPTLSPILFFPLFPLRSVSRLRHRQSALMGLLDRYSCTPAML